LPPSGPRRRSPPRGALDRRRRESPPRQQHSGSSSSRATSERRLTHPRDCRAYILRRIADGHARSRDALRGTSSAFVGRRCT
jgi:hypothetical protein